MQERNISTISYVWNNALLRKIFLDIVSGTQLRKCRHLRGLFIRKVDALVRHRLTDEAIYAEMHKFVHQEIPSDIRQNIQHLGHYRGINRSGKIVDLVKQHGSGAPIGRVLDVGCDDGSITKVLREKLALEPSAIFGCDVRPLATSDFTFILVPEVPEDGIHRLPFPDAHFDVVYALMSLHHIRDIRSMLAEIRRVLVPGGLLIVREHDCVTNGLGLVLDVVHGFYSMVWSEPQELTCFHEQYWAYYRTAGQLDTVIAEAGLTRAMGTNRDEPYPLYYHGKVVNPLKHYWAVYRR